MTRKLRATTAFRRVCSRGHTTSSQLTRMLGSGDGTAGALPASYHYYDGTGRRNSRAVGNLAYDENTLPEDELSLGGLGEMRKHLVAGFPRPATQLQLQVAISREIVVADHMDLRLVWHH